MAFNYRKSDKEKLRKEVTRYNRKINRMRKNPKYKNVTLPATLSVREIEKTLGDRKDYNRVINSIDRFFRPGANKIVQTEAGLKLTAYEKKEFSIKLRTVNAKRTRELKKRGQTLVFAGEHETGMTREEIGGQRLEDLQPRTVNVERIRSRADFRNVLQSLDRQLMSGYDEERKRLYYENYIKGLRNELGVLAEPLIEKVKKLTVDQLLDIYYGEQDGNIDFIYDPLSVQMRAEVIEEILDRALING